MKTQKGFAALESLLILAIIAVIGGIGWYAYNSKSKTDKILSQADKISQDAPLATKKSSISPTSQNYLTIKEWGIKIKLTDASKITYTYSNKSGNTPNGSYKSSIQPEIKPDF